MFFLAGLSPFLAALRVQKWSRSFGAMYVRSRHIAPPRPRARWRLVRRWVSRPARCARPRRTCVRRPRWCQEASRGKRDLWVRRSALARPSPLWQSDPVSPHALASRLASPARRADARPAPSLTHTSLSLSPLSANRHNLHRRRRSRRDPRGSDPARAGHVPQGLGVRARRVDVVLDLLPLLQGRRHADLRSRPALRARRRRPPLSPATSTGRAESAERAPRACKTQPTCRIEPRTTHARLEKTRHSARVSTPRGKHRSTFRVFKRFVRGARLARPAQTGAAPRGEPARGVTSRTQRWGPNARIVCRCAFLAFQTRVERISRADVVWAPRRRPFSR